MLEINSSHKIAQLMRLLIPPADKDTLLGAVWLIGIDAAHNICVIERTQCSPEGFNMFKDTLLPSRWEPYRIACSNGSRYMILVHTHRAGDLMPSKEDLVFTRRQIQDGKDLAVQVIDHIIISGDEHYSMADNGILGISPDLLKTITDNRLIS